LAKERRGFGGLYSLHQAVSDPVVFLMRAEPVGEAG
jgi:hypothetical protein